MRISGYRARLVDEKLENMLSTFGAVCIEGPKWCGKTWTGMHHCTSDIFIGDPTGNFQNRQMANLNPELVLEGAKPRLIDEWQEVPSIWDAVRYKVDSLGNHGLFILTGSATPSYKGVLHSGTGRIARLRMRPMSLFESGESSGQASIKALFDGTQKDVFSGEVMLDNLIDLVVRGGWPGGLDAPKAMRSEIAMSYIDSIVKDDVNRVASSNHSSRKIELLLRSLARNESTTASLNKIIADMSEKDGEKIDSETATSYIDVLKRMFLIDNQQPFSGRLRSSTRLKQAEKRHLADPSLACAILKATPSMLRNDLNTFGFLFEALCERDLRIYAESLGGELLHYQDYNNKEIDAVVQLPDGRWGAFEVKLGANQVEEAAASLLSINRSFEEKGDKKPDVLAVVCGMSSATYRRKDGVYVIPITALCP